MTYKLMWHSLITVTDYEILYGVAPHHDQDIVPVRLGARC